MSAKTIAFYGGSFDPPHVAHVLAAAWAKASAEVDEVWVVPSYDHAFGKESAPFEARLQMCRLAMADLRSTVVSDIEREQGLSRTYDVVEAIAAREHQARFRLLIGSDILADAHRWYRWDDLVQRAPPLVIGREGYPSKAPITLPGVSSTEVRRRIATGESIEGLVSPEVARYARAHALYTGKR